MHIKLFHLQKVPRIKRSAFNQIKYVSFPFYTHNNVVYARIEVDLASLK